MKKYLQILFILTLSILLQSCVALFNTSPNRVKIKTIPDSAEVYIENEYIGISPITINIDESKIYRNLIIKKEGYQTQSIKIEKSSVWGYIILDAITFYPILIDYASHSNFSKINNLSHSILLSKLNDTSYYHTYKFHNTIYIDGFYIFLTENTSVNYRFSLFPILSNSDRFWDFGINLGYGYGSFFFNELENYGYTRNIMASFKNVSKLKDSWQTYSIGLTYVDRFYQEQLYSNVPPYNNTSIINHTQHLRSFSFLYSSNYEIKRAEGNDWFWGWSYGYYRFGTYLNLTLGFDF